MPKMHQNKIKLARKSPNFKENTMPRIGLFAPILPASNSSAGFANRPLTIWAKLAQRVRNSKMPRNADIAEIPSRVGIQAT